MSSGRDLRVNSGEDLSHRIRRKAGYTQAFQTSHVLHGNIQVHIQQQKGGCSEITMTLKRVYPSEYQRVQGAFKDSMIH